ncbi:MAG: tRNA-intron endonuclease, archaea type [Methanohalophilus sp.]|nr:MAG: tRNA-intron endonuclease, archaea type [Methanohalophilus sp.]
MPSLFTVYRVLGLIGKLKEDRVVAGKEAIEEIYKTSYYGRPKKDNLILTLVEAAHLLYRKKLEIEKEGKSLGFEEYFIHPEVMYMFIRKELPFLCPFF